MLIVLDLPALAVFGISNWLFGFPCCLTDAFSADYLLTSALGWLALASIAGLATAWFVSRRHAVTAA